MIEMDPMTKTPQPKPDAGLPRWLLYGFAGKIVLVVSVTVGVLWWKGFIF